MPTVLHKYFPTASECQKEGGGLYCIFFGPAQSLNICGKKCAVAPKKKKNVPIHNLPGTLPWASSQDGKTLPHNHIVQFVLEKMFCTRPMLQDAF